MTGYNHTLTGCLLVTVLPAPVALPAAFLSHFVLDAMPHFGNSKVFAPYNRAFINLLLVDASLCVGALALAIWLSPAIWLLLAAGAALATLPDFMWLLEGRVKLLDGFFRFAKAIQWGEYPWGWVLEIAYGLALVAALLVVA